MKINQHHICANNSMRCTHTHAQFSSLYMTIIFTLDRMETFDDFHTDVFSDAASTKH